jgi:hypothetical protein
MKKHHHIAGDVSLFSIRRGRTIVQRMRKRSFSVPARKDGAPLATIPGLEPAVVRSLNIHKKRIDNIFTDHLIYE